MRAGAGPVDKGFPGGHRGMRKKKELPGEHGGMRKKKELSGGHGEAGKTQSHSQEEEERKIWQI